MIKKLKLLHFIVVVMVLSILCNCIVSFATTDSSENTVESQIQIEEVSNSEKAEEVLEAENVIDNQLEDESEDIKSDEVTEELVDGLENIESDDITEELPEKSEEVESDDTAEELVDKSEDLESENITEDITDESENIDVDSNIILDDEIIEDEETVETENKKTIAYMLAVMFERTKQRVYSEEILCHNYLEHMTSEDWDYYRTYTLGNYVGIGIYMTQNSSGEIVVVEPVEGSPAERAGLIADDIIEEVNEEYVTGEDINLVSSKIKGIEGTTVKLKIYRQKEDTHFTVNVLRSAIRIYRIESEVLENNIGYAKISTFDDGCSNDFKNVLEKYKQLGIQKLVIDLRDNTGGIVNEALDMVKMVVPEDDIVTSELENEQEVIERNKDIVILINEQSAGASEIFTTCLKDTENTTVVGTKSMGLRNRKLYN